MKLNGNIPNYAANGASNPLNNSALLPPNIVGHISQNQPFTAHSATWCGVCRFLCAINSIIHS